MVEFIGLTLIIATALFFSVIGILYSKKHVSIEDFISLRNSSKFTVVVATLVASSMGVWILFSPAEASVTWGITALIGYAVGSAAALFVFAWIGVKLRKMMPNGHTLAEYVFHRFGTGMYILVLLVIIFYMAVFLTAELTGISLAAKFVFDIPLVYTAVIVGLGTVIYTAFGGIKASIFTDRFQYILILPLLIIIFVFSIFLLGGFDDIVTKANEIDSKTFDLGYKPGIQTAITLIIAIVGANLFHQGYWQRVYIAKTNRIMKDSFMIAGIIVIFIILIAGSFGMFAIVENTADNASVAFFTFLLGAMPEWVLFVVMVLAVVLVMSSMDTLLNGLVSLFTVDLVRLKPKISKKNVLTIARWVTVVLAGLAILIATKGFSVLYLFLIADLVCAAAAFPTFYGLYSRRINGKVALISSIIGIVLGALFFPDPAFSRGNLLYSFLIALIVPALITLIFSQLNRNKFDFRVLQKKIVVLDR